MQPGIRRRRGLAAAAAVLLTAGAATAAFGFGSSSTNLLRVNVRANTITAARSSTDFGDLSGATVALSVPSGTTRLVIARFAADGSCIGNAPGDQCVARIVARNNSNSTLTELQPTGGGFRAFDSATLSTGDARESHAMDGSLRLGPGSYDIKVQWAVRKAAPANTVTFSVFSYHLKVEIWE